MRFLICAVLALTFNLSGVCLAAPDAAPADKPAVTAPATVVEKAETKADPVEAGEVEAVVAKPKVALLCIGQADVFKRPDFWGITNLNSYEVIRSALVNKIPGADFLTVKQTVDVLIKLNQAELNSVGLDKAQIQQLMTKLGADYAVVFRDSNGIFQKNRDVVFSPQVLIFSRTGLISDQRVSILIKKNVYKPGKDKEFLAQYGAAIANHVAETGAVK